jgi:hypothetical protein
MSMHGRIRDAGSRMAAAVDAAEERKALDAKIREVEKELTGAAGDERVALQQRLTALEQQKLLLMQQQSGATGWAHSQGAGLLVANLPIREQSVCESMHGVLLHGAVWCLW